MRRFATHAALTLATVATLYPILWVLKLALSPSQGAQLSASPIPTQVTLANFHDVLTLHGKVCDREGQGRSYLWREYGVGDFYRTFQLSEQIDSSRISAEFTF